MPNATVNGSPRSIAPVARAEQAEAGPLARASASGGRTAASRPSRAGATASRSVMPGRRPSRRSRTPRRGLAGRVLEGGELLDLVDDPQPVGGDRSGGRWRSRRRPVGAGRPAQLVDEIRGRLDRRPGRRRSSSRRRRPAARARCPPRARISPSGRDRSRGWLGRLKSWKQVAPHRQGRGAGHAPALVADQDRRLALGPTTSSRLLEARVEPGEVREVGAVLAVGVDDEPVEAALRWRALAAVRVASRRARPGCPASCSGIPKSGRARGPRGPCGSRASRSSHRSPLRHGVHGSAAVAPRSMRHDPVGDDVQPRPDLAIGPA